MRRSLRSTAVAAALLASPLVAGADPDPCMLVSRSDAALILGSPVTRTSTRANGDATSCAYHTAKFHTLSVTVQPFSSVDEARRIFADEVTNPMSKGASVTKVAGVGDEAHVIDRLLYARKGTTIYSFAAIEPDPSGDVLKRTEAVAKASLAAR